MEILLREGDLEEVVDDPADLGLGEAQFDEVIDGGVDPPLPWLRPRPLPSLGLWPHHRLLLTPLAWAAL
jgi:hypothetical protein